MTAAAADAVFSNTQNCIRGVLVPMLLKGERNRESLVKTASGFCERIFIASASNQLIDEKIRNNLFGLAHDTVIALANAELNAILKQGP